VILPGRTWDDYLTLAVTEIREYGACTMQVGRRLRAMLEDLHQAVLPEHRHAVAAELTRLDSTISAGFASSPDRDKAFTPDPQGIGGQTH